MTAFPDILPPRLDIEEGFIIWLKAQDPLDAYDYEHPQLCAFGQYLSSLGHSDYGVSNDCYRITPRFGAHGAIFPYIEFSSRDFGNALLREEETFGALLQRLESIR